MVFNIPPNSTAVDDEGRTAVFSDGEENVPITGFDATTGIIEFRLYGSYFWIKQSELAPEYEYRAFGPNWQSAPSASLIDTRTHAERTGGRVERRVKAGPWERVEG